MSPLEFLNEEFENVKRALKETLRHDYVPERSKAYYDECVARLAEIGRSISSVAPADNVQIAAQVNELSLLAHWISFIERSHLGEFSWQFAEELHRLARALLVEHDMAGNRLEPIVHVVAEGHGYRITYESRVPSASGRRRFVIVAFPRSLKHHVLLHSIFGHELCHTAIFTTTAGGVIHAAVVPNLIAAGPMKDEASINSWLQAPSAPQEVKDLLASYQAAVGNAFHLFNYYREQWLVELICDLFGLLLFGPAFMAAHRALLRPMHPYPYGIGLSEPTHPPYAVRHKMLVRVMQLVGWDVPITTTANGEIHETEKELLQYLLEDPYDNWGTVFTDAQLQASITAIQGLFHSLEDVGHVRPDAERLTLLTNRLRRGIPPISGDVDVYGAVLLERIDITQILYAGWMCWIGRAKLTGKVDASFFGTNRLCDVALLQQRAINLAMPPGDIEWQSWAAKH
jgi:hypothetical protein